MGAKRPTSDYKNKTNVNPVNNRSQEATAEDYLESAEVMEDHADILDVLTGSASPNPNYGVYSSLSFLQAAHPTGEAGAYAIIDTGYGSTPQLAIWDTTDLQWSLSEASDTLIYAPTYNELPAPGIENIVYITQNDYKIFVWKKNQYNELSKSTGEGGEGTNIENVHGKINTRVDIVEGNWNIDWLAGDTFDFPSGLTDIVLTETNLPTGVVTKDIVLNIKGLRSVDIMTNLPHWEKMGGIYNGAEDNAIFVTCRNGTSGLEKIQYWINTRLI